MTEPTFPTLRPLVAHALLAVFLLQGMLPLAARAAPRLDGGGGEARDDAPTAVDGAVRPPRPIQRLEGAVRPPRPIQRLEGAVRPPRPIQRFDQSPDPEKPQRFSWKAPSGFTVDVEARPASGGGHSATAVLRDRSGETMTFEFLPATEAGPVVLIDDSILLAYETAADGRVSGLVVDDGFRAAKTTRNRHRPERAGEDAYLLLLDGLLRNHSPQFLAAMEVAMADLGAGAIAPAGMRDVMECVLGATGYVLSIWGLVAGCTVAGFATIGASCILAIFAHEVAVASAVLSCLP